MADGTYHDWIGRTNTISDYIAHGTATAMAATIDRAETVFDDGDPLPHLWHWLYFLERPRTGELGTDGHTKRGGFLPPVHLPRRMWGGSRLRFHRPLRIGESATRISRIKNIVEKQGRNGALVIVTIEHTIEGNDGGAITEEQDVVYRENARPGGDGGSKQSVEVPEAQWSRSLIPDPVLLFRYSALTFNSHRIHYDQPYATKEEGYPALIVHGPLVATLLLEEFAVQAPSPKISTLTIRAMRPLFQGTSVQLQGRLLEEDRMVGLWALDESGAMAIQVNAELDT